MNNSYEQLKQSKLFVKHKQNSNNLLECKDRCCDDYSFCKHCCQYYNDCKSGTINYKREMRMINETKQEDIKLDKDIIKQYNLPKEAVQAIEDLARAAARSEVYTVLNDVAKDVQ